MSVFGILAKGRGTGPSLEKQQRDLALRKMTVLSDEVMKLELALANKRMQLESAQSYATSIGAPEPHARRTSYVGISGDNTPASQADGRRKSRSQIRNFCYKIKQIRFHGTDSEIIIAEGPCIIKIGISHFTKDQDKQAVAELADIVRVKVNRKEWGAIGVLLSKFNRAHAVQCCGSDTYTLVTLAN